LKNFIKKFLFNSNFKRSFLVLRWDFLRFLARLRTNSMHKRYLSKYNQLPSKLHFGCGSRKIKGWLNCDVQESDLDIDLASGLLPFKEEIFEFIVSQHCIEHLWLIDELQPLINNMFKCLKQDGEIWLSCPDIQKICQDYNDTNGTGLVNDRKSRFPDYSTHGYPSSYVINDLFHQGGGHKNLFDYNLLKSVLIKAGFNNCIQVNETIFLDKFPDFLKRNDDFQSLYIMAQKN
jgi:predicted SAM-dependent methyltransferase